jgi:hypothetical protein
METRHAAVLIANWVSPREPLNIDAKMTIAQLIAVGGHCSLLACWVKHSLSLGASAEGIRVGRAIFGGSLFPEPKKVTHRGRRSQLADAMELIDKAILDMHGGRGWIGPDGEFEAKLQVAIFVALSEIAENLAAKSEDDEADSDDRPRLSLLSKILR